MNDSRNEVRALWCRQLSGEHLNEKESRLLRNTLRNDLELKRELIDDATSHALLRSLEDVVRTEEDFVQAVMQQATAVQEGPLATPKSTPLVPVIKTDSEASWEPKPPGSPILADDQSDNDRKRGSRQRSQQWISLLLTLVLFLTVGLIFWFQGEGQSEIAGTGPSSQDHRVDQKLETPLLEGSPEPLTNRSVAATDDVSPSDSEASGDAGHSPPQLATNDNSSASSTPRDKLAEPKSPAMAEETLPMVAPQAFATLTKLENPVWEREDTVGTRVGDEVVRLFGGTIELTFDNGAVVSLEGPVEFQPRAADLLDLRRGQLSATVPKPAIGFTVITPTSEVVDLGTEFDVAVKETGASDVVVRKGEVEVAPSGRNGKNIQKWKLTPRRLNRASFLARPDNAKPGPIAATAEGANGQFRGIISLDGRKAEFRSADTFHSFHERVMTQFKTAPENTQRQWQDFVDSMQRQMRGTMNFNGRQMQFGNLDEVMRLHNQIQANTNSGTPFNGSININGKVIQFKTQEEFEAARRAAFGPAANFGAGDVFDKLREPK